MIRPASSMVGDDVYILTSEVGKKSCYQSYLFTFWQYYKTLCKKMLFWSKERQLKPVCSKMSYFPGFCCYGQTNIIISAYRKSKALNNYFWLFFFFIKNTNIDTDKDISQLNINWLRINKFFFVVLFFWYVQTDTK